MAKKLTQEEFIEKAKKVHSDKYDYSKVEYINFRNKVCIICPEHGEFWQKPLHHLFNHGCPKCGGREKLTKEIFIEKARKVHGNKYDYSKVEYLNNKTKVCIICQEHGEFWQRPDDHLNGKGCYKCAGIGLNTEEIIKLFKKVHGNKYDYSKSEYINNKTKICIICKKHGEFLQFVGDHLNGHGCPKCNQSKLEKEIETFLKNNKIIFEQQKKFDWLGRQSLDFYLPYKNLAIECQGEQHFKPIGLFGGERGYKNRLECDKRKRLLCEKNGIKLIYFTHCKNINNISDIYDNKDNLLYEINKE